MPYRYVLAVLAGTLSTAALGEAEPGVEQVVVTATRTPEAVDRVPVDISVVSGNELRLRDAWDMQGGLSLVSGVEAPAGGDAGPSSAVPSFWGLHEFDAFLLVVDGVPWGGAFNPAISTLDMNDVERIEVLKGAAPVMYGATSFVGVVQLLHYPAGEAASQAEIAGGSYGSGRGDVSLVLPQWDGIKQSLALDGQSLGFADRRESASDGQFLYRGALDIGPGTLTLDADMAVARDVPPSPVVRVGSALTDLTPLNANFNPANAQIDENRYHGALGWTEDTAWGTWVVLASYAHSDIIDIRAFLHPDLSGAADTQDQHRLVNDGYFDTHLESEQIADVTIIAGTDLLYGYGRQATLNGNSAYTVPLNGSVVPPPTWALPVNEIGSVNDKRLFVGQYFQADWKPDDDWDVIAGLRLNETFEHKFTTDFLPSSPSSYAAGTANRNVVRPSETFGASYRAWEDGGDEAVLYADYRNAFKPAALDFGPDYQPAVLLPETAQSYEAGVKGSLAQSRLTYEADAFLQRFQNLVVATPSGFLTNAAKETLKGIELETRFHVTGDLALVANIAYHDARFGQYLFFDGANTIDVAGKALPLSPHLLASGGLLYAPAQGFNASVVVNYVGRRYLDEENVAPVSAYATLAVTLGYRFDNWLLSAEGTNLTNERPPVSASEFGSQSFYLLNARQLWLKLGYAL